MREGYRRQRRLRVRRGRRPEIDAAQGEQSLGRAVRVGTQQIPAGLQLAHIEMLGQAVAGRVEQGIKRQQMQHAVGRNIEPVETGEVIAQLAKQLFVQRLRGGPAGSAVDIGQDGRDLLRCLCHRAEVEHADVVPGQQQPGPMRRADLEGGKGNRPVLPDLEQRGALRQDLLQVAQADVAHLQMALVVAAEAPQRQLLGIEVALQLLDLPCIAAAVIQRGEPAAQGRRSRVPGLVLSGHRRGARSAPDRLPPPPAGP